MKLWWSKREIRESILEWLNVGGEQLTPLQMQRRFRGRLLSPSIGTIYAVLDPLEESGTIVWSWEEGAPERGGARQRRYIGRAPL